jgi:nucleoid DNA-binding protein
MNKKDLARLLARQSHRSRAQAADAVDTLLHRLLMDLKKPDSQANGRGSLAKAEPGQPKETS